MNNLVLGKYIPLDSIMHRLDPRAKLVALILMIVAIFVPKSWYVFLVIGIILVVEILLAKLNFKYVLSSVKPMMFMMVFLLIINVLTLKTGDLLVKLGPVEIYADALFNTLFVVTRLLLMIMVTTTLTATTKPLDLTLGIEHLLKPLQVIKFPTHEIAMMISIALRFIPTIIEETMRIMDAQKSRGVDFENGKLSEKIGAILSLIIPLFSVAFERAYELADAMEARGYVPGAERTRYHVLKFEVRDYIYLFLNIVVMGLSIASRFVL